MALEHILAATLLARSEPKGAEFAARVLGLRDAGPFPVGGRAFALPEGPTRLVVRGASLEEAVEVGGDSGIGLTCGDLRATADALRARGAAMPWGTLAADEEGGVHATLEDPDGNLLMLYQPEAAARGPPGLRAVGFVNVVVEDLERAARFWRALGLAEGDALEEQGWQEMRLGRGASVGLLCPEEAEYETPAEYARDLGHAGEETGLVFAARDLGAAHAALRGAGAAVARPPERGARGAWARYTDTDGNAFTVLEAR